MPLVFSPLSEELIGEPPKILLPKTAFIMRQLGDPPNIDLTMTEIVREVFAGSGFLTTDAAQSTGGKDYLERILGLIRATGLTVAIFSHATRPDTMANIALELGFAAMCGKPLVIVKSAEAVAPSDLKRTDWIDYDESHEIQFRGKLNQAADQLDELVGYEDALLSASLEARSIDCGVAFERANKAFLLSGHVKFIDAAEEIRRRLEEIEEGTSIGDLERLRSEVATFIHQARASLSSS